MNAGDIMKTLTIRGIDDRVSKELKKRAKKQDTSVNQTVIQILKKTLGLEKNTIFKEYDDLNKLAGTWKNKELKNFNNDIKDFDKIDRDIWK